MTRVMKPVPVPSVEPENLPIRDDTAVTVTAPLISENHFRRMLCRERKRSERSRKHLLLMLIETETTPHRKSENTILKHVADIVCATIRETDLAGWFETNAMLGVIFTELGSTEVQCAAKIIESKITEGLLRSLKTHQLQNLQVSFHAFPQDLDVDGHAHTVVPALYPDLFEARERRKLSLLTKRAMDIIGSSLALVFLSPIFLILTILIKLTSKGPIFFRQQRLGQFGVPFVFLKFRSMHDSTSADIHKEYVRNFIAGKAETITGDGKQKVVYKITNDPRVTWIGKIMRRTSLDELPQFWDVLKGDMSLVGPRPPIPYEIKAYDIWHRRRLIDAKPGITGLWQVHGRSKTTFDDMVRLDLRYSRTWSLLLDIKILLRTPRAVVSGDGAY